MGKNYTVLHLHTELSSAFTTLDSINSHTQFTDKAKELNMKAIAFTEHGNIMGHVDKKRYAEKNGLKYIHGVEAYVTEDIDERVYDNYHVNLYAKNRDGYYELNQLMSEATVRSDKYVYDDMNSTESYYYQPRISYEDLKGTSDNIIILTACLGGILNSAPKHMQNDFMQFMAENRHRCFLEIQHHNVKDQAIYNQKLLQLSKQYGVELVACTDTHALTDECMEGRRILQESKNIHFKHEDAWDLVFKTYDELVHAFEVQGALDEDVYLRAIENTNHIADMIEEFDFDYSFKYPNVHDNPKQELLNIINEGIAWRGYEVTSEVKERIKREIDVFDKNHMFDFILLDADIKKWCRENNIEYGESRGSISGSLIAYLIGITHIDPIKYGLIFERFVHDERVGLADIDSDYNPKDIPRIKEYIYSKHGLHCADVITYNTIALKGAIRSVGKTFENLSQVKIDEMCDNIEVDEDKYREKYPKLFKYVDMLNGTVVSIGSHPAAVCIADENLAKTLGVFYTNTNKYPVLQLDMREVESLNYLKLDVLKLDTIGIINDTCKIANIDRLRDWNVDYTDTDVWGSMLDSTAMIFQWNGFSGETYYKQLFSNENLARLREQSGEVDYINLFSIGNAAIRPAGTSYRDDLAKGVTPDYHNAQLNDFFEPTFNFLVYQEDLQNFLHEFCGFTLGEADMVRRGLAKKTSTEQFIPSIKAGFTQTMYDKYGMCQDEAEDVITSFLQVVIDSVDYMFSKNHSIAYSIIGFQTAYLRYYHPLEFITTNLNYADTEKKMTEVLEYMGSFTDITLEPIKFRYSSAEYTMNKEENAIYKGIESIKYLNAKVANEMYELRDNEYENFYYVLKDLAKKTSLNARQLKILISLNFFDEFGNNKKLLQYNELFTELYGKKQLSKAKAKELDLDINFVKAHSRETAKTHMDFDSESILLHELRNIPNEKLGLREQIEKEAEYYGYIEFTEPRASSNFYVVSSFKTYNDRRKPYLTLYQVKTGKTMRTKVTAPRYFEINPFKLYSVLRVKKFRTQKKWRNPNETEQVLVDWQVV